MNKEVRILFAKKMSGKLNVKYGHLLSPEVFEGDTVIASFSCDLLAPGARGTISKVETGEFAFSFFLRDVRADWPVWVPEYGVAVTTSSDLRSYQEIIAAVSARGGSSRMEQYEAEPQESYDCAAANVRDMHCPIWLGLGRDIRIFETGFRSEEMYSSFSASQQDQVVWDWIKPRYHCDGVNLPQLGDEVVQYSYLMGRGLGCVHKLERALEKKVLPILHAWLDDEDIIYHAEMFATHELRPLNTDTVEGTHYLVADHHAFMNVQTAAQAAEEEKLETSCTQKDEEVVLYLRITAENSLSSPKYAYLRLPEPNLGQMPDLAPHHPQYDGGRGFGVMSDGTVYMSATLNGLPCPQLETAILLAPREQAVWDIKIPHRPVCSKRAEVMGKQDFNSRKEECVAYWESKLEDAAKFILPEKRITEMMTAGLLHIELAYYGCEPDGPIAPVVGVYSPIGSESAPAILYLDSIGKTHLAERAIRFFFEKQHEDGFMQNFQGYMLETGAVLWTLGEHWRLTGNTDLISELKTKVLLACRFLIRWIAQDCDQPLRSNSYGMITGKVADPEDNFHSFMLNGYTYIGLARSAEMLSALGDLENEEIVSAAAKELLENIRTALAKNMANSPVIPLGNGTWVPTCAPWTDYEGPLCLHADGGNCVTHGGATLRDSLLGACWLFVQEVIDPREPMGEMILKHYTELYCYRNVGYSQPYYSAHPYAHLIRGEVGAFLKEFYNGFASLADRSTYTFWEHYFHDSIHKLHEESWFLMRCRWMLWLEDGSVLRLMAAVPDAWASPGEKIAVHNARSRFGSLSFEAKYSTDGNSCDFSGHIGEKPPQKLIVRLPHTQGKKPISVSKGRLEGGCAIFDNPGRDVSFTAYFEV